MRQSVSNVQNTGHALPATDIVKAIKTKDNQTAIAVCTLLMQRVHQLIKESGKLVFLDAMDRNNHRVFMLLTHSVAGGLPLGVLILSN